MRLTTQYRQFVVDVCRLRFSQIDTVVRDAILDARYRILDILDMITEI